MNRLIVIIVLAIALGNVAVLDYLYLSRDSSQPVTTKEITKIVKEVVTTVPPQIDNKCSGSCLSAIREATAEAAPRGGAAAFTTGTRTTIPRATGIGGESFITLATGSFHSEYDWADVPGAQVTIDRATYGDLKSVIFEAVINTPNGNEDVNLRLYNDTAKHPVWFSELLFPSGTETHFLVSQNMTLDPGTNIYKVQMKTQFATNASLDLARIHITSY
ncbi:hypothetical protein HYS00_02325 [Candidatus Microgenomates bacterium]|nr:hypothetical protein [Candidatus Microgenomates bacterium]